ncbi:entericidin A/B family lipoprotein [uncultured Kiloniella sp.]|uniref:entericidin A/B family lipoprotein n=1 Tax=Kiloniella sp. TaxID=1938587 RepID=UPI002613C05E|nr:entericidin A/B family lipoprotein [uncultured Kiloniella sp.]
MKLLKSLKVLSVFTTLLFSIGALSACNTIEGAGKDIEAAGESIEDAADDD